MLSVFVDETGAGTDERTNEQVLFSSSAVAACASSQGIPLTVPGTLGYLAVAGLALVPLLVRNDDLDKQTRSLILVSDGYLEQDGRP